MKRIYSLAIMLLSMTPLLAQETYENAKIINEDLNGTARYVGMGGAMEALGADISTIGSNPAGVGLFRKSSVSMSFGAVFQQDAKSFSDANKANLSFDQVGFVYSNQTGANSYINLGVNYHKSKNFDYILSASDALNNASQNSLSFAKAIGRDDDNGATILNIEETSSGLYGVDPWTSQLDNLYYNNFLIEQDGSAGWNVASGYDFNRAHKGYVGEFDLNLSGNINGRVFLGLTVGIHDVHYKGYSEYKEELVNYQDKPIGSVTVVDQRKITGAGFDIKIGGIFRPVEESPFRIGVYAATPTWYDLKTENRTHMVNNTYIKPYNSNFIQSNGYKFKLYTPWKFGMSIGHTVGNYLALGASYEYSDYGKTDTRIKDGDAYYDWYGDYHDPSSSDRVMNDHTEKTLKGVSTVKLGMEYKPFDEMAVRFGYNYISPMYNKDGYKDGTLDSYGSNYSSATDFTNWEATNRITCGLGYTIGQLSLDLAYQYSVSNGSFKPFMDSWGNFNYIDTDGQRKTDMIDSYPGSTKVSNKRHQLLFTVAYKL